MLKLLHCAWYDYQPAQPPSGGCVLKLDIIGLLETVRDPAAFGRLCVETLWLTLMELSSVSQPPSGGCVLKHHY